MMEFDDNTNSTPITEEQRRLAATKKVTLQPVHGDVSPAGQTDAEIAAHHLASPAIANAPNDTEQNKRPVMPSKEHLEASPLPKRHIASLIAVTAVITLAAATVCGSVVWWLLSL